MERREGPSVALGTAAVIGLAALFVAGRLVWQSFPSRTPPAEACCKAPIEIVDAEGARLGCASDVPCVTQVGDRVQVPGCVVSSQGMSAGMRVLIGLKINVNAATADDLMKVDGVSAALAHHIIEAREQRGRFDTVDALSAIPGVGPATLASLQKHLSTE